MIKNFYIFRNGQSSHNYIGKLQGQNNNSVLTDEGINQALLAADHLKDKNIDIVISSPQRRAKQPGSIVAKKIKAPIHYDSRLVELNLGDVEGMKLQKLSPKQLDVLHQWYNNSSNDNIHFKNGESKIELRKRIREALNDYTSKEYNNVAISSHNFPILETLQSMNISKNDIANGEIIHIQYDGSDWKYVASI